MAHGAVGVFPLRIPCGLEVDPGYEEPIIDARTLVSCDDAREPSPAREQRGAASQAMT